MTGKESNLRKLNKSSLRRAQVCTRWSCCVNGCRDCLVTAFGSRSAVRLDAVPPSRCGFPCEHDSRLKEDRWKPSRAVNCCPGVRFVFQAWFERYNGSEMLPLSPKRRTTMATRFRICTGSWSEMKIWLDQQTEHWK